MAGLKGMSRLPKSSQRERRNASVFQSNLDLILGNGLEVGDDGLFAVVVQDPILLDSSGVGLSYSTGLQVVGSDLTTNDSEIVHDDLSGFVPNEHIDWTNATQNFVTSGSGVFGGPLGIGISPPISVLHLYEDTSATDTTNGLTIEQDGTGDATLQLLLTGGQRWIVGIDNSAGDRFSISSGTSLTSSQVLSITSVGNFQINANGFAGGGQISQFAKISSDTLQTIYVMVLDRGDGNGGAGLGLRWLMQLENGAGARHDAANMEVSWTDAGDGTETVEWVFNVMANGSFASPLTFLGSTSTFAGDVLFATEGSGLAYGEISAYDVSDTLTISGTGIGNKVQVTSFDTDGPSNNTTPSSASDDITITKAGYYFCTVSVVVESVGAGSPAEIGVSVFKNNGATEFQNLHAHRQLAGGGGDTGSLSLSGILDLAVDDTIELWVWNETNTDDIIVDDVTLSLVQIGGT